MTEPHRAGIVAVIGRPNVGKSTLLNGILGVKVSIVSSRPQTTRNRVMGVHTVPGLQVAFVDTPGIWPGLEGRPLHDRMMAEAQEAIGGVDAVVLLIEPGRESDPEYNRWMLDLIRTAGSPALLAINKIDLVDRRTLLPILAAYADIGAFEAMVPICARTSDGVDALLTEVGALMPESPPLFPEDMLTDSSERFLCAEIVREKVFRRTGQEIPYATAVEIERFEEAAEGQPVRIFARILVEKDSQKPIVVGKGGQMIKAIGTDARRDIQRLLGGPAYLELYVSVSPQWSRKPAAVKRLGHFED
jgi:GTPase